MNGTVYGNFERIGQDTLAKFAEIGVATIHESMETEALLDQSLRPIVPGSRLAGQAVTVQNSPGNNLGVHVGLEVAQPGDVLVITPGTVHPGGGAGMWGGVVTECAHARKVGGVITDGYVRDTSVIRDLSFPVWAKGVSPRSGGKNSIVGVNIPVSCGGVLVYPGDVIVADSDGVVVVRYATVADVLSKAIERQSREEALVAVLRAGDTTTFRQMGYQSLVDDGVLTFVGTAWQGSS